MERVGCREGDTASDEPSVLNFHTPSLDDALPGLLRALEGLLIYDRRDLVARPEHPR